MKKLVVGLVVAVLAAVTALAFGVLGEAAIPSTESFTFCSGSANASFGPDGEGPTTSGLGAIGDPDPVTDHDAVSPIVPPIVFPVDAVIIDRNPGWGLVAGSQWISYGLTTFAGPPNSTLVTFTVNFVLPPGATNPALAVTTIQDDTVDIYLNGLFEVTHAGHTQASQLTHTTIGSINPGPASNELRFDVKQVGGDGFGLDYCATVTFTTLFTFCSGSANASFGPNGEGPSTSGLGTIGDPDPVTDHDAVSPIAPPIVFPVDAVIIDRNPGWGLVAGSQWISYGRTTFAGPPNSTLVTFTVNFVVPPGATNPALAITTIQDDTVDIYLNGLFEVTHAGHTQASQLTHTTTGSINPGPASNELRFDLKQVGGDGFGLDYCATVTFTPAPPGDKDGDGVPDASDNCPKTANPSQSDADGDTIGDLCDTETGVAGTGDCGDGLDNDGDGLIDGADPGCPVIYKGLEHTPLGAATLTLIADTLVVGNIGSSGDDGVSSDVSRPPPDRTLTWGFETTDTLDPAVLPTGAFRRVTLIGEIDGVPGQVAGQTAIEDVGGSLRLTADFSSLGSSAVTINLFLGGELVGQVTGYSGPGIQIDEAFGSTITETYMWRRNGSLKSCTIITTGAHEVQVIGGPSALVDKIEVIPEGATALLNTLTNVTIEAADLPSITITDETVSGIPAVGGIAELPDVDALSQEAAESGGGSAPLYAAIAGGLGAAVLAIAVGGWYARRRWLR